MATTTVKEFRHIQYSLKALTIIMFVLMAIMTTGVVQSFRSSQKAADNSLINQRTLFLVEGCLVDGNCGNTDSRQKSLNYFLDSVACILSVDTAQRSDSIEPCKAEAAKKFSN